MRRKQSSQKCEVLWLGAIPARHMVNANNTRSGDDRINSDEGSVTDRRDDHGTL
jgi:hypothetical protein